MENCALGPSHIKVVLVDDHDLTRVGAKKVLQDDTCMVVVGEARGSDEAIFVISRTQPDVVSLDIRLMPGNGIDVVKASSKDAKNTKLLILSAFDDENYVIPLVRLGVHGYLLKTASSTEFTKAVHDVAAGNLVFPRDIADIVLGVLKDESKIPVPAVCAGLLTARESQVLGHMGKGLTNREIAENLGISQKTVESHVQHLLAKLGVTTRTQAVVAAFKNEFTR